jgi:hypothetical protein
MTRCGYLTTAAALGLKTALSKGERGPQVQWIGVRFALVDGNLILFLPEKYTKELIEKLKAWEGKGLAPLRDLRQVAGKTSWMAGLLPRTRWVVTVFYKVMHTRVADIQSGAEDRRRSARRDTRSKDNFFNRNQLEQARKWLVTYLETAMNKPSRKLRMDIGKYPKATIITDASPTGLGAILLRDAEELGFTLEHCRDPGSADSDPTLGAGAAELSGDVGGGVGQPDSALQAPTRL